MTKRQFLSLALAASMATVLFTGCGSQSANASTSATDAASGGSTSASDEKKVLRVGLECAYAPFNWTQSTNETPDGNKGVPIYGSTEYAYGYDVMMAQKIADQLGWELELHKVEWSSIVLGLQSNQYDAIIAGMSWSQERDASVDFTDTYYKRDNVLVVKSDSPLKDSVSLDDFKGCSVVTQLNTSWVELTKQIPEGNLQTNMETTAEACMAVSSGKVDCAILDEPTAKSACTSNPDLTYVKLAEDKTFQVPEGTSNNCCIAVRNGDSAFVDQLNEALKALQWDDAKMAEMMDQAIEYQPAAQ